MSDTEAPDITNNWSLRRGSSNDRTSRFHLDVAIDAQFVDPTRDEVRNALLQALDEALGVDPTSEIAGWAGWEVIRTTVETSDYELDDLTVDQQLELLDELLGPLDADLSIGQGARLASIMGAHGWIHRPQVD